MSGFSFTSSGEDADPIVLNSIVTISKTFQSTIVTMDTALAIEGLFMAPEGSLPASAIANNSVEFPDYLLAQYDIDSPLSNHLFQKKFMQSMAQSLMTMGRYKIKNMELSNKEKVAALLDSFNTGDQTPISYINPNKYIQHNLSVADGLAGFGAVMQHAPPGGFKAKVVRAFQDGDYVFTHTEYDFFGPKAGFDVFRFEDGLIVEHWDNLLPVQAVNPSGHTQFDGATDITDKEKTAANKQVVQDLLQNVFMNGQMDEIATYINPTKYIQHNPNVPDGLEGLGGAMKEMAEKGMMMEYTKIHKVLGEGNFVLTMSEGKLGTTPTAYYDLFRLENGQIIEHWDVIAPIPPKSEWKNDNGKF